MVWYKKQLMKKLKILDEKKPKAKKESIEQQTNPSFDPSKIKSGKRAFKNPVAEMNRNRKKTDIF